MTFALAAPLMANAHEVPSDVTVQMFVRPAGDRLELLVRVPLEAMRDLDLPLRGPGYLDLANVERLEPALRYAAMVWIADGVEVFEQDPSAANMGARLGATLAALRPVVCRLQHGGRARSR